MANEHQVLVFGGRDYPNRDLVYLTLDKALSVYGSNLTVISGMARGVDRFAYEWAILRKVKVLEFPASWDKYGKRAGHIRNQQMLDEGCPDSAICFPGGTGTADMLRRLKLAGVHVLMKDV